MRNERNRLENFLKATVAAVALLLGTGGATSAAGSFQCQTNAATPQQVRQQGITELVGDLVLNCTGGAATGLNAPVPTVDITVTLNTEVTSRLLDTNVNGSEALLLVDEPSPGTQSVCLAAVAPCPMGGQGAIATSTYLPALGNKNVFQGHWDPNQPGSIVFRSIPIDPPGTARDNLVMRVTNIRGNATRFDTSTVTIGGIPIYMTVSISNPSMMPINDPQEIVAFVFNGLVQQQDNPVSFQQCKEVNASNGKLHFQGAAGDFVHNPGFAGVVKAVEGFASAFKIRNRAGSGATTPSDQDVPGTYYPAVESGFYNTGATDTDFTDARIASAGLADSGTRIKVEFNNVPAGVHVYVPLKILASTLEADLAAHETGDFQPAGPSSFDPNGLLSEVALSAGAGVAIYEIVAEDPSNTEELDVPVIIAYAANSPAITTLPTAGVTFAPNTFPPDYIAENNGTPAPRFLNTTAQASRFSINACAANPPTVSVNPQKLSFNFQIGDNAPADQGFSVLSANPSNGLGFNASLGAGCNWLTLNHASGVTPANLTASAHVAGLAPTTYSCAISIGAPSASNSPQIVNASLTVVRPAPPPSGPALTLSPNSLVFNTTGSQEPSPQGLFLFTGEVSLSFSVTPSTVSGGNWLVAGPSSGATPSTLNVSVNPAGLAAGVYQGSLTVNCPSSHPGLEVVPVTLNVASVLAPPPLSVPPSFAFSFSAGAHQPQSRHVTIAGPATFHASADAPWLSITPSEGTAGAATPALLSITADPTGLNTGTYTGSITVTSPQAGLLLHALVTVTVSDSAQSILLSQTGLSFHTAATASGGTVPAQPLYILRDGSGTLNWSLTPITVSGGNWLSTSSATGSAGDTASLLSVQIAAAGLAPGVYYGQLRLDAPGAANSPQFVGVALTVFNGDSIEPMVDPIGLLFAGPNPAAQIVSITNRSTSPLTFVSGTSFAGTSAWFTVQPRAGSIKPGQTQQISIQPNAVAMLQGTVYQGALDLGFSDHSTERINLVFMAPVGASQSAAVSCAPSGVIPLVTSIGGEGRVSVGVPAAVQVKVVNNCGGIPEGNGSLELQFTSGDPAVPLVPLPGGIWAGTFTPKTATTGQLGISVLGEIGSEPVLPNTWPVSFTYTSIAPLVMPSGVSSATSHSASAPLAPGALIDISGNRLAVRPAQVSGYPLPIEIIGTEVTLAGTAMPLFSVSEDGILAQVPYETAFNTTQQLVVKRGFTQTPPEELQVAPAQPAILTVNGQGTGQAMATIGTNFADASHPVKAGETIAIYCAGLGAVTPPVSSGAPAPANPLSRTVTPAVTIGDKPAQVLFSGLAPGYVGLYQVNVVIPTGISPGDDVALVLSIDGQTSPAVTIAVR